MRPAEDDAVPTQRPEQAQPPQTTDATPCARCEKLEAKLEKVENQRDELVEENRNLLKENGLLREENATLRERWRREQGTLFDERKPTPPSSLHPHGLPD